MAQIAALSLMNGASTPVSKTFNPKEASATLALWADNSGGIVAGSPTVSLIHSQEGKIRTKVRVTLPIMEVSSGGTIDGYQPRPKVAYNLTFSGELVADRVSSIDARKDLLAFAKDLMTKSVVSQAFIDNERPW